MVQSDIINRLIDAYIKYRKGIVVPVHKGKRGHPILIGTRYFVDIKKLDHTQGLRQLMRENAGDIHEVEVDSNTILKDIDTIEEYKKELI